MLRSILSAFGLFLELFGSFFVPVYPVAFGPFTVFLDQF